MRETPVINTTQEDTMSTSETSGSTGTLTMPSPTSEDTESDVFESRPQIIDPLRFPVQDDTKSSRRQNNEKEILSTVKYNCSKSPQIASNIKSSKICPERDVQKCQNFVLSELELSLPSYETYQTEIVDFPSSPPNSRSPNINSTGMRLEEDTSHLKTLSQEDNSLRESSEKVTIKKVLHPKNLELRYEKKRNISYDNALTTDDDQHSMTSLSYHNSDDEDYTNALTPDDIHTADPLEESIMERLGPEPQVAGSSSNADDTSDPENSWRSVIISGIQRRIDMTVIEPYKKVLSHGGYMPGEGNEAIIVFSACFLPDRSRMDYDYVMDHLFMYVLTSLHQLVSEDYALVYLHGATTRGNMPSFAWLKRCYQMIDRRLRKNLQGLYLVHPSFWVKTVVIMARPFVSSKFSRKLRFISSLKELKTTIPLDQMSIPARVKQYDDIRESLLSGKR